MRKPTVVGVSGLSEGRSIGGAFSAAICRIASVLLLGCLLSTGESRAGLIGFYPFDDAEDPLADASDAGNDLQGGVADPTYSPSGGFQGGAYHFDGTQRLIVPIDINPTINPTLTMGAWVKTDSLVPGLRKVMGHDDGGWDRTIGLDNREDIFRYTTFTGSRPMPGTPGPESTEEWSFIAATYDENNLQVTFYVDVNAATVGDDLIAVTDPEPSAFLSGFPTASIGNLRPDNNSEGWVGFIDNVFFYDEILTPEQLKELRDRGRGAILGTPPDDPDIRVLSKPDLKNFGRTPATHTFTIEVSNGGASTPLNITNARVEGPDAAHYTATAPQQPIAPGATGSVQVVFDPMGQTGDFSARLTLESNDPSDPAVVLDLSARVKAASLLGFYSFDDAANPLTDDSGSGKVLQDGADGGASDPTYNPSGGVAGGAFEFNGSQRLVAPIDINPSVVPQFTMGAWVKTATLEPEIPGKILGHDDGGWDRVIGLDNRAEAAGGPLEPVLRYAAFTGENNFGPTQGDPPPTPTSTEEWTFLVAVYDQAQNEVRLYVDLDASSTSDAPQVITSATSMGVGAPTVSIGSITPTSNGEPWIGSIDNVFFMAGTLDETEIRSIRDGGRDALLQYRPNAVLAVPAESPFGELSNASPRTVTLDLRNLGTVQPLRITAARVVGKDAANYTLGALPQSVEPGATVPLSITFNPQGREGLFEATLELVSNNSSGRLTSVDLTAEVPFSTLGAALLGFYPFDDEENPLKDESGKGNDLQTVENAVPAYTPDGGFEGGVYEFFGFERLIAPININPTVVPQLTMGAWVKTYNLDSGLRKVMGHDDGGWDRVIGLDSRNEDLRYAAFTGTGITLGAPDTTPVSTDDWTFLAAVYDQPAETVTVYVDLEATTTDDPLFSRTETAVLGTGLTTTSIGNLRPDNDAEGWVGLIDNAFLYATALTEEQITEIRDGGSAAIRPSGNGGGSLRVTATFANGVLTLSWNSDAGETYLIQYSETLPGTWIEIGTQVAQGASASFQESDATRLGRPAGFYRIELRP